MLFQMTKKTTGVIVWTSPNLKLKMTTKIMTFQRQMKMRSTATEDIIHSQQQQTTTTTEVTESEKVQFQLIANILEEE